MIRPGIGLIYEENWITKSLLDALVYAYVRMARKAIPANDFLKKWHDFFDVRPYGRIGILLI